MRRRRWIQSTAVLIGGSAVVTRAGDNHAARPAEHRTLLPLIAQLGGSTLTTLVHEDCGFVAAVVVPATSRVILGYIIRPGGNLLHIAEDVGDHLVEVQNPMLAALIFGDAQAPAFTFPGPKQGTCALVITGGVLHIYATSRDEGDETGPFKLKRLSMPVPPPAG